MKSIRYIVHKVNRLRKKFIGKILCSTAFIRSRQQLILFFVWKYNKKEGKVGIGKEDDMETE